MKKPSMKIGGFFINDLQGFQNLVGLFFMPTRSEKDLAGFLLFRNQTIKLNLKKTQFSI